MNRPILMLVPSLNRPEAVSEALHSLTSTGTGLSDYLILGGEGGVTQTFNAVPSELLRCYEILGLWGDDVRMQTKGWDKLVLEKLTGRVALVYGRDGIQDQRLCTHPFFASKIALVLGFIQPPALRHFYGDNFYMELMTAVGAIEFLPELFTEHQHCQTGKSPADETYHKANAFFQQDTEAWAKYRQENLALDIDRLRPFVK